MLRNVQGGNEGMGSIKRGTMFKSEKWRNIAERGKKKIDPKPTCPSLKTITKEFGRFY